MKLNSKYWTIISIISKATKAKCYCDYPIQDLKWLLDSLKSFVADCSLRPKQIFSSSEVQYNLIGWFIPA